MDFARKQLEKYGWKDGDGLGKECQGMSVALKPHLKTGKTGMGWDLCKDLTDTWWTRAYSDSLQRISVDKDGAVSIQDKEGDKADKDVRAKMYLDAGLEERPMEKMRRRMMKANFTEFSQGGTLLTNGELVSKSGPEESRDKVIVKVLTDEELLKACGGRTAHKAARFGMKLNGKLARIAAQESNNFTFESSRKSSPVEGEASSACSSNSEEIVSELEEAPLKKKKDKKRKRNLESSKEPEEILPVSDTIDDIPPPPKKKTNKKNKKETLPEEDEEIDNNEDKSIVQDQIQIQCLLTSSPLEAPKAKRRKSKKQLDPEISDNLSISENHNELETVIVVKQKKSKTKQILDLNAHKVTESLLLQ